MLFFLVYTKYYDSSFIIDNFLVLGTFEDNTKMLARIPTGVRISILCSFSCGSKIRSKSAFVKTGFTQKRLCTAPDITVPPDFQYSTKIYPSYIGTFKLLEIFGIAY